MNSSTAARLARAGIALAATAALGACTTKAPSADSTTTSSMSSTSSAPTTATTTATTTGTTAATATSSGSASTPDTSWRTLVGGNATTTAWRGYKTQAFPSNWKVVGDTLTKSGSADDLISRDEFGDFELTWDWKLDPGGNAGIFYRASEEYDKIYWSGTEYQLLDDAKQPDGKSRLTSAGSAYGLYPSPKGFVKPANQWNSSRIVARGPHVEHWLNGHKVVEYEAWSADWKAKVKASKFSAYPDYGLAKRGHLGIQGDHDGTLAIRNMRIRELQ
jgi:3-keto-disaccharide hydrolase